jgi:hypothetical protein
MVAVQEFPAFGFTTMAPSARPNVAETSFIAPGDVGTAMRLNNVVDFKGAHAADPQRYHKSVHRSNPLTNLTKGHRNITIVDALEPAKFTSGAANQRPTFDSDDGGVAPFGTPVQTARMSLSRPERPTLGRPRLDSTPDVAPPVDRGLARQTASSSSIRSIRPRLDSDAAYGSGPGGQGGSNDPRFASVNPHSVATHEAMIGRNPGADADYGAPGVRHQSPTTISSQATKNIYFSPTELEHDNDSTDVDRADGDGQDEYLESEGAPVGGGAAPPLRSRGLPQADDDEYLGVSSGTNGTVQRARRGTLDKDLQEEYLAVEDDASDVRTATLARQSSPGDDDQEEYLAVDGPTGRAARRGVPDDGDQEEYLAVDANHASVHRARRGTMDKELQEEYLAVDARDANGWRSRALPQFDNDDEGGDQEEYLAVDAPSGSTRRAVRVRQDVPLNDDDDDQEEYLAVDDRSATTARRGEQADDDQEEYLAVDAPRSSIGWRSRALPQFNDDGEDDDAGVDARGRKATTWDDARERTNTKFDDDEEYLALPGASGSVHTARRAALDRYHTQGGDGSHAKQVFAPDDDYANVGDNGVGDDEVSFLSAIGGSDPVFTASRWGQPVLPAVTGDSTGDELDDLVAEAELGENGAPSSSQAGLDSSGTDSNFFFARTAVNDSSSRDSIDVDDDQEASSSDPATAATTSHKDAVLRSDRAVNDGADADVTADDEAEEDEPTALPPSDAPRTAVRVVQNASTRPLSFVRGSIHGRHSEVVFRDAEPPYPAADASQRWSVNSVDVDLDDDDDDDLTNSASGGRGGADGTGSAQPADAIPASAFRLAAHGKFGTRPSGRRMNSRIGRLAAKGKLSIPEENSSQVEPDADVDVDAKDEYIE